MRYITIFSSAIVLSALSAFAFSPVNAASLPSSSLVNDATTPVTTTVAALTDTLTSPLITSPTPATTPTSVTTPTTTAPTTTTQTPTNRRSGVVGSIIPTTQVLPSVSPAPTQMTASTPTVTNSTDSAEATQVEPTMNQVAEVSSSKAVDNSSESAATANDQSTGAMNGINYGSNQISPSLAKTLYESAAAVSIGGFIVYALTSLQIRHLRTPIKLFRFRTAN